jgi:hypothetical protein
VNPVIHCTVLKSKYANPELSYLSISISYSLPFSINHNKKICYKNNNISNRELRIVNVQPSWWLSHIQFNSLFLHFKDYFLSESKRNIIFPIRIWHIRVPAPFFLETNKY